MRTTTPEGMLRVNLSHESKIAGYPTPKWVSRLFEDLKKAIISDLHIPEKDVFDYMYPKVVSVGFGAFRREKLAELLKTYIGVESIAYHIEGVPSFGLLFRLNDPIVVEYKLKYGENNNES